MDLNFLKTANNAIKAECDAAIAEISSIKDESYKDNKDFYKRLYLSSIKSAKSYWGLFKCYGFKDDIFKQAALNELKQAREYKNQF